jgi:hypothetical protein
MNKIAKILNMIKYLKKIKQEKRKILFGKLRFAQKISLIIQKVLFSFIC